MVEQRIGQATFLCVTSNGGYLEEIISARGNPEMYVDLLPFSPWNVGKAVQPGLPSTRASPRFSHFAQCMPRPWACDDSGKWMPKHIHSLSADVPNTLHIGHAPIDVRYKHFFLSQQFLFDSFIYHFGEHNKFAAVAHCVCHTLILLK